METGTIDLPDLLTRLEGRSLYYRLALLKDSEKWKTHTLMILDHAPDDGSEPPTFAYAYGHAQFHSRAIDSQTVGEWLTKRGGELSPAEEGGQPLRFSLFPFIGMASWQRWPSYYEVDWQTLPWPITRYEATGVPNGFVPQPSTGFLLSGNAPFFPDFRTALLKLIYQVDNPNADVNNSPSPAVAVRLAESEAFLRQIDITATAIRVTVAGYGVTGARLIISDGAQLEFDHILEGAQTEELLLPRGAPPAFYVVLSRGERWLDYYRRDERWPLSRGDQANVTIERPPINPQVEIETLIAQGEGLRVEFKRELNPDNRQRLLSTVSAFANMAGGTILIGVDNDGLVQRLPGDVSDLRDTVMRTIHDNIMPMPNVDALVIECEGESVIVVTVESNLGDPCGVVVNAAPRYFIRRGATNFHAQPSEITDLILLRHPTTTQPDPFISYR